jgi:hypothetical protein
MRYKLMKSKEMVLSFKALCKAVLRRKPAMVNTIQRFYVSKPNPLLFGSITPISQTKEIIR